MSDALEPFEQRLRRQPLKQIPGEWRSAILATVAADTERRRGASPEFSFAATVAAGLRRIFWPSPMAWAGLAAAWACIFILQFSARDPAPAFAEKIAPPSAEMVAQLRQQRRMMAELIGAREPRDADRSKIFVPQPRSNRTVWAV